MYPPFDPPPITPRTTMYTSEITEDTYYDGETFMRFQDRLSAAIELFISAEIDNKCQLFTQRDELRTFDLKTFYSKTQEALRFRDFFLASERRGETIDPIFNKIIDLYTIIRLEFPIQFIDLIETTHHYTLRGLGYEVDPEIATAFPYGWLLAKLQYNGRHANWVKRSAI